MIDGLIGKKKYIPLIKGGNGNFFRETDWFALWNKEAVNIIFDEQYFNEINGIVKKILTNKDTSLGLKQIDEIFGTIYQLND